MSAKQLLKRLAVAGLSQANAFPSRKTSRDEVAVLIDSLRPVDVGKPLIRLGPAGDGGYLVPDDLAGITALFSPGVDRVSGFELDCAELGMDVFMADRSVDSPPIAHERFNFVRKYIGATNNEAFMTLDSWVASAGDKGKGELLLQIDIEGYEYEAFMSLSDGLLSRFRIIAAEFHDLNMLWSKPFFRIASRVFEKILQTHYCVHIHPNNVGEIIHVDGLEIPLLAEFTFIRRDRATTVQWATALPHPLDADNSSMPSMPLPACWYRRS